MEIATTIEQSNRLISCGINPKTADMCWTQRTHRIDGSPIRRSHQKANLWMGYPCKRTLTDDEQRTDTPAWSLSALLAIIPQRIIAPKVNTPCDFMLHHFQTEWCAMFHDGKLSGDPDDYIWQCMSEQGADTPIEACVKIIEWLTANGYSLNTSN